MRPVVILAALFTAAALVPASASSLPPVSVTVLLQFEQEHSALTVREMQQELEGIFKQTGYRFDWKLMDNVSPAESFDDLVVVKMKGRCDMEPYPLAYDERGPLAFTHSSDGHVLPFSEVECDKVRRSVQRAATKADGRRGEQLLGRALGRVLAHEMYHIFANTCHHGQEGVAKTALSGSQLVSDKLAFGASELHALAHRRQ